jgi:hypothetical protein
MVTKSRRQERKMPPDQPVIDTTPYGYGKDDSVTDLTEKSAITNHVLVTKGKSIYGDGRASGHDGSVQCAAGGEDILRGVYR